MIQHALLSLASGALLKAGEPACLTTTVTTTTTTTTSSSSTTTTTTTTTVTMSSRAAGVRPVRRRKRVARGLDRRPRETCS